MKNNLKFFYKNNFLAKIFCKNVDFGAIMYAFSA